MTYIQRYCWKTFFIPCFALLLLFDTTVIPRVTGSSGEAEAKYRSSYRSSSFSRSSYSSNKSSRYSSSSQKKKNTSKYNNSSRKKDTKYSSSSRKNQNSGRVSSNTRSSQSRSSKYDKVAQKKSSAKSFTSFKKSKTQKLASVENVRKSPSFAQKTKRKKYTNRKKLNTTRKTYVNNYYNNNPGRVQYVSTGSSFGGFTDVFLGMMMYDAVFGYNHRYDPGYAEWRREADMRAQEDKELRSQLAELDKQVADLEAKGTPRDPNYLPQDIPAEVIYSNDVLTGTVETPKLVVATGLKGGNYYAVCQELKQNAGTAFDITCKLTKGSKNNLALLLSGGADVAIAQSDVIADYLKLNRRASFGENQQSLYPEFVYMITKKGNGIDDISDLSSRNVVYVGESGSGASMTWKGIVTQDSSYGKLRVINESYDSAIQKVLNDPKSVLLYVSKSGSQFIDDIERKYGAKLHLVNINDRDLDDMKDKERNKVYKFNTIPEGTYTGLQSGKYWGTNETETLVVDSVFILSPEWVSKYGDGNKQKVRSLLYLSN